MVLGELELMDVDKGRTDHKDRALMLRILVSHEQIFSVIMTNSEGTVQNTRMYSH